MAGARLWLAAVGIQQLVAYLSFAVRPGFKLLRESKSRGLAIF